MSEVEQLKSQIAQLQRRVIELESSQRSVSTPTLSLPPFAPISRLSNEEIKRYGRQIIVEEIGLEGNNPSFPPFLALLGLIFISQVN